MYFGTIEQLDFLLPDLASKLRENPRQEINGYVYRVVEGRVYRVKALLKRFNM